MLRRVAGRAAAVAAVMAFAAMPAIAQGDPVIAIVDGAGIRRSEAEDAYKRLPEQYRTIPFEAIFSALVGSMVDTKLAAADARKKNLHNEDEFKRQMIRIEEQALERAAVNRQVKEGTTPKALKSKYDEMVAEMSKRVEVRARHILVDSEAKAKDVIAELEKGTDFADVAKKRSLDPSNRDGGDLGYFAEDQMVPAFTKAAFVLEPGKYTKAPVQTQFGWHVIKVEDRRNAVAPPYKAAEDELKQDLSREIGTAYIERLRKGANVQLFSPDGGPLK